MRTPLRARLSQVRQRILLTIRYYTQLPIDQVRRVERDVLDQQVANTLRMQAAFIQQLHVRLQWYETRVPLLRKEHKAFRAFQKKQRQAEAERQAAFQELVQAGVDPAQARDRIWSPPEPKKATVDEAVVGAIKPKRRKRAR